MKIRKITIVKTRHGADDILMETNLPSGQYPFNGTQSLKTSVARGNGEEWVKMHFPSTETEIIKYGDVE